MWGVGRLEGDGLIKELQSAAETERLLNYIDRKYTSGRNIMASGYKSKDSWLPVGAVPVE